MSEPRKKSKKNPEDTSVDWAEKLKASMSEGYSESDTDTDHTDDDLAALLRAQLGKSTENTSLMDSLDTSEFEEEFDDEEEFDEDEIDDEFAVDGVLEEDSESEEDYSEDTEEDYSEDTEEDYSEDTEEDYSEDTEEDYSEDTEEDYSEDTEEDYSEDTEEDYSEDTEEDYSEETEEDYSEDTEEDYPEDTEEDYSEDTEEDYPEDTEEDYSEEIEEDYSEETETNAAIADVAEQSIDAPVYRTKPTGEYRRPEAERLTDDLLNGLVFSDMVGGPRLKAISDENARLLEEEAFATVRDLSLDDDSAAIRDQVDPESENATEDLGASETRESSTTSRRQAKQIHDPLQLGLDDVSPTVKSKKRHEISMASDISDPDEVTEGNDYPHIRTQEGTEESLQDMGLCLHLGYEEAMRHSDEQAQIELLRTRQHETRETRQTGEVCSVRFKREYRGREDTSAVEKAYVKARRWNFFRLLYAVIGGFVAIIYDLLPLIIPSDSELALSYASLYAPVGLLGTLLVCLPFLTRLFKGIKSLLDFEPTRYTVSGTAILISLLHSGAACFAGDPYSLPLFGGVALLMLSFASLSEYLVTEGEHRAFTVVSSGKLARVLTSESTPSASALRQKLSRQAEDGQTRVPPDEQTVLTVVRARRVADYFARTRRYNPYMGRLNYMLPVALLCSIVCAGLALILGDGIWTEGMQVFTATYLACLPAAYIVALTLPLFRANGILENKGAAVIGTAAPVEYAGKQSAHVIFADGHALKALYRKDVTLRGDDDSADSRRTADVIFRLLDTPLAVEPTLQNRSLDGYRIDIAEIQNEYVRLYLMDDETERTTEIMMGSHEALTHRGIRLPKIGMEQRYKKSAGSHVLYVAFNRNFHLAYAVEYRVGRTFAKTAMILSDMGYRVSLSSFDPLVDTDMEGINRLRRRTPIEVLRPAEYEPIREICSGGLIVTGRSLDLLQPLIACRKMKRAYRKAHLISWLGLLASVGLSALAVSLGGIALLSSGILTLWQLLGMGSMLAVSYATVGSLSAEPETAKTASNTEAKPEKNKNP